MPTLRLIRGLDTEQTYELTADEFSVGSGIRNDLVFQDADISPKHCRFEKIGMEYRLFDLGSKRGTFVNGKLVLSDGVLLNTRVAIELGDSITLEYIPGEQTQRMDTVPPTARTADSAFAKQFYLVIKRASESQPEVYALDMNVVTIGRDLGNDIVLPEPKISRHHIRLERVNKGYIVHDLKTSNGTYVNRHKIELPTLLQNGDFIAVADAVEMWFTDNIESLKL